MGKRDYVQITPDKSKIQFKLQDGPVKEVGLNGCQVDDILSVLTTLIQKFDNEFPCTENKIVLDSLNLAAYALELRKTNREKRNVEGRNLP